jgi:hypothetical protein
MYLFSGDLIELRSYYFGLDYVLKIKFNSNEEPLKVVVDLWLAGMETTTTTMKWAFLYMIRNPEVSKKNLKLNKF